MLPAVLSAATVPLWGAFVASVLAQTITDGDETVAATNETVAPAVQVVSADSTSLDADYFDFEAAQLTPDVLANLTSLDLTNVTLFDFGDTSASKRSVGSTSKCKVVPRSNSCKVLPGDAAWPNKIEWLLLDLLTGGALIQGVPSAAVCYEDWPQYNEEQCANVTAEWEVPSYQSGEPTGIDFPLFEGVTCLPPTLTRTGANCTLGGLPSYVLKVSNVAQIQLALNFARNLNVRVVVKNKGHDFNAKSTGAGALSIWTNGLQDMTFLSSYTANGVSGPAIKIGSGVTTLGLYEFADANGVEVVGGVARTVGLGGGYIAGGGHSPLSSRYGMAADQVLAMEVVLPDGTFVSVSSTKNPDLFWALRGGGGGTFGIVTSLILRAYPKQPVATLEYSISSTNVSIDTFWQGVDAFWASFPEVADAGHYRYFSIVCSSSTACSLSLAPHWANNATKATLEAINENFFSNLSALGIPIENAVYAEYDGVLNAFTNTFTAASEVVGTWSYHTGSRLFPRSNWEDSDKLANQSSVIRAAATEAGMMLGYNIKAATNTGVNQDNAVNPAWRNTLLHAMLGAVWGSDATPADIAAANEVLTERLQTWRDASPGAGAYLNEADINEPDWQQSFYGTNYDRLYSLKQQYDPWGLLWGPTAVGSENWYITDQIAYYPTQNGRLCPA